MAFPIPQIILIGTSLYGFYAIWGLSASNGYLALANAHHATGKLPDGHPWPYPIASNSVQEQLRFIVNIFWPLIDGSKPDVSLQAFYFGGQLLSLLPVFWLEARRRSLSPTNIASFVSGFLMVGQCVGAGVVTGAWLALHLWFSPNTGDPKAEDLIVDTTELAFFPLTITISFIVPMILQCLPAPRISRYETKIFWAGIWQIFPITMYLVQLLLVGSTKLLGLSPKHRTTDDLKAASQRGLNRLYGFCLALAAASHWSALGISAIAYLFPDVFKPEYATAFQPSHVFVPRRPWSDVKAADLGEGMLFFLQWDYVMMSVSAIYWALHLRIKAKREQSSLFRWIRATILVVFMSAAVGPMAVPLIAFWGRDSLVFGREKGKLAPKSLK